MPFTPPAWKDFAFHFEREDRARMWGFRWMGPRSEVVVVLDAPLRWRDPVETSHEILAPAGFRNDGASLGPIARLTMKALGSSWEEILRAAVIHDVPYRGVDIIVNGLRVPSSRRYADLAIYRAMREDRATRLAGDVVWAGVRVGGWLAWRSNRRTLELEG